LVVAGFVGGGLVGVGTEWMGGVIHLGMFLLRNGGLVLNWVYLYMEGITLIGFGFVQLCYLVDGIV